jgi:hypothetical protein
MMAENSALRIAMTGATDNRRRELIAAVLRAPDIAAIHATTAMWPASPSISRVLNSG